jgi:hypothetical protein
MGLKGYRLWVMGQLDSNVQSPTYVARASELHHHLRRLRDVAVQVEFESSKNFEAGLGGFSLAMFDC